MERREKIEQVVRERERVRFEQISKRWTRREENEFLRVLTGYGIDLQIDASLPTPDWSKFKSFAKLDKKSDENLSDYYKVFITMCKRQANVQLNDDEKGLDGLIDDISEDHAKLVLDRLELLSKLREIVKHPKLAENIKLCENNIDTPDWWKPGHHDKELINAVLKHGLYRSDQYIYNDTEFPFSEDEQKYYKDLELQIKYNLKEDSIKSTEMLQFDNKNEITVELEKGEGTLKIEMVSKKEDENDILIKQCDQPMTEENNEDKTTTADSDLIPVEPDNLNKETESDIKITTQIEEIDKTECKEEIGIIDTELTNQPSTENDLEEIEKMTTESEVKDSDENINSETSSSNTKELNENQEEVFKESKVVSTDMPNEEVITLETNIEDDKIENNDENETIQDETEVEVKATENEIPIENKIAIENEISIENKTIDTTEEIPLVSETLSGPSVEAQISKSNVIPNFSEEEEKCSKQAAELKARFPDLEVFQPLMKLKQLDSYLLNDNAQGM